MDGLSKRLQEAVENSLVHHIASGSWITTSWDSKQTVPKERLKMIMDAVNWGNVMDRVTSRIEDRIADSIFNAMATEIATDVKKVMCNHEIREDFRFQLRTLMTKHSEKLKGE